MPCIINKAADIIICSSSILKRGTINQLPEAPYNNYAIDNMDSANVNTYDDAYEHLKQNIDRFNCDIRDIFAK